MKYELQQFWFFPGFIGNFQYFRSLAKCRRPFPLLEIGGTGSENGGGAMCRFPRYCYHFYEPPLLATDEPLLNEESTGHKGCQNGWKFIFSKFQLNKCNFHQKLTF
jgi:hypothetical protein